MSTATMPAQVGTAETIRQNGILPSPRRDPGGNSPLSRTSQVAAGASPTSQLSAVETGQRQENTEDVSPPIHLTGGQSPARRFKVLQQWEGIVSDVQIDVLMADILDLTDPSKPREIVEIPLVEIPEADHHLLLPGCVFYWIIGYQTSPGGQKSRVSEIRVRRNPKWSQHAIESIKARGKELYEKFNDSGEDNSA